VLKYITNVPHSKKEPRFEAARRETNTPDLAVTNNRPTLTRHPY